MGKIRYICTGCGNGFTTRGAANRHLKNTEKGGASILGEAEYRIGLTTGKYQPPTPGKPPTYRKSLDAQAIAKEEYLRGYWRRIGELDGETAFRDQSNPGELQAWRALLQRQLMSEIFSK